MPRCADVAGQTLPGAHHLMGVHGLTMDRLLESIHNVLWGSYHAGG